MEIDKKKCVGCGNCHAICPMGAIHVDEDGKSIVNQDECVECFTCYRVLRDERYPPWFVRTLRKGLSLFRLGYLAAVDVCPTMDVDETVCAIIAELHDPNRLLVEVGYGEQGRVTLEAV